MRTLVGSPARITSISTAQPPCGLGGSWSHANLCNPVTLGGGNDTQVGLA